MAVKQAMANKQLTCTERMVMEKYPVLRMLNLINLLLKIIKVSGKGLHGAAFLLKLFLIFLVGHTSFQYG